MNSQLGENECMDDDGTLNEEIVNSESLELFAQGAEARLTRGIFLGRSVIVKERFSKKYRHPCLDEHLTKERMKSEIRCLARCRNIGIQTPPLFFVDNIRNILVMGFVEDAITVREYIVSVQSNNPDKSDSILHPLATEIGRIISLLHENHVVHGDLTTSNMLIRKPFEKVDVVLIDFGLSYIDQMVEDKAVDLYVLEKAFISTHPNSECLVEHILQSYEANFQKNNGAKKVLAKLCEVRMRGRKRLMIG